MRRLKYWQAFNEGLYQLLDTDPDVIIWGQGTLSPWYVGNLCKDLAEKFPDRILDTPVSENAVAGATVGMAMSGLKPIMIFPRHDFVLYAADPIINQAAKAHYMSGGRAKAPLVYILIINRGNCQGPQHSQDFTFIFEGIPGLKVTSPKTPYDVKGAIIAAVQDPNPVIFIDNRDRYGIEGEVPEEMYSLPDLIKENEGCPIPTSEALESIYFERYGR